MLFWFLFFLFLSLDSLEDLLYVPQQLPLLLLLHLRQPHREVYIHYLQPLLQVILDAALVDLSYCYVLVLQLFTYLLGSFQKMLSHLSEDLSGLLSPPPIVFYEGPQISFEIVHLILYFKIFLSVLSVYVRDQIFIGGN